MLGQVLAEGISRELHQMWQVWHLPRSQAGLSSEMVFLIAWLLSLVVPRVLSSAFCQAAERQVRAIASAGLLTALERRHKFRDRKR
jgi:hypothetical protein